MDKHIEQNIGVSQAPRSDRQADASIIFYFDPISPYAYLAFERLPQALEGMTYRVRYKPVLFAGMLKKHGQLGPAEIAPKRDWTYRQVMWQAREWGIPLQMPASHPFNPLGLLRLATACADDEGHTNRYVTQQVFQQVWQGGHQDAGDANRLSQLQLALSGRMLRSPEADSVWIKERLKANTDEALRLGCFGVPSMVVNHRVFWGADALPMLRAYLQGDAWFEDELHGWSSVAQVGAGVVRT